MLSCVFHPTSMILFLFRSLICKFEYLFFFFFVLLTNKSISFRCVRPPNYWLLTEKESSFLQRRGEHLWRGNVIIGGLWSTGLACEFRKSGKLGRVNVQKTRKPQVPSDLAVLELLLAEFWLQKFPIDLSQHRGPPISRLSLHLSTAATNLVVNKWNCALVSRQLGSRKRGRHCGVAI